MTVKSLAMMSKLRAAVLGNRCTLAKGGDVGLLRLGSYVPSSGAPQRDRMSHIDRHVTRRAGLKWEEALWTSP